MSKRVQTLVILAAISVATLIISNLVGVKLWNFFGVAVDGGLLIFPLTYIIGDLIAELFGTKTANRLVVLGFAMDLLAVLVIFLVGLLPAYPGWTDQAAYDAILGSTPRLVAASLLAYLASGFLNNFVFDRIKRRTGKKLLALRTLGSSLVAKVADTLIFETVAFLGVLPLSDFAHQVIFAYVAAIFLETLLTPVTYLCVAKLKPLTEPAPKELTND